MKCELVVWNVRCRDDEIPRDTVGKKGGFGQNVGGTAPEFIKKISGSFISN